MVSGRIITLDLDGTLISCEPRQTSVLRAVCLSLDAACDFTQVWSLKRDGHSLISALIRCGWEPKLAEQASNRWQHLIENPGWLVLDRVLPTVFASLARLRDQGISLSLLTARKREEWVRPQLRNLRLIHYFEQIHVVSGHCAAQQKAEVLDRIKPRLFIGDTEVDSEASQLGGCYFAAVSTGQRSTGFLQDKGAAIVAASLQEALDYAADAIGEFN